MSSMVAATEATEIERRTAPIRGGDARGIEFQVDELAVKAHRLAVEQLAQNLHVLECPLVSRLGFELLSGEIAGDDVDIESALAHLASMPSV
jgi:hypothetical protein